MNPRNLANERIGQVRKNNFGSLMEVVEYRNTQNISVKFLEHGNIIHTNWNDFCKGSIKNNNDKTIYNIGYIGIGNYKTISENKKHTRQYSTWKDLLRRCYNDKYKEKHTAYKDCTVTEDWHNFQNFAKWYDQNYYEIEGERMCLDKDILVKGNKIYSPNTCIFVPSRINCLFLSSTATRGDFPIGVSYRKDRNNFEAKYTNFYGKTVRIGSYKTAIDAFNAYKNTKEELIKQIAEIYQEKIPKKVFEAMLKFKIDIAD